MSCNTENTRILILLTKNARFEPPRGPVWSLSEASWGPLGASWRPLGGRLEPLGSLLEAFERHLQPSEIVFKYLMSPYTENERFV